jgi:hypothetical protein
MINSASKCLRISFKVIKLSNPETKFPKKIKLRGDLISHPPSGGNPATHH